MRHLNELAKGRGRRVRRVQTPLLAILLAVLSTQGIVQAQDESVEGGIPVATIRALNCDRSDEGFVVSYRVERAFGGVVTEGLEAGQTVRFHHTLSLRRRGFLWIPRTLARSHIEVSASLDTL